MTAKERFWSKVNKNGPAPERCPELGPCWLWTAAIDQSGYGKFGLNTRTKKSHRFSYELLIGPIPDGLDIDHLCRIRNCVNPAHLEPVLRHVNILRGEAGVVRAAQQRTKTHCPKGHSYSGENLYITSKGARQCRTCKREAVRRYEAKRKAA